MISYIWLIISCIGSLFLYVSLDYGLFIGKNIGMGFMPVILSLLLILISLFLCFSTKNIKTVNLIIIKLFICVLLFTTFSYNMNIFSGVSALTLSYFYMFRDV